MHESLAESTRNMSESINNISKINFSSLTKRHGQYATSLLICHQKTKKKFEKKYSQILNERNFIEDSLANLQLQKVIYNSHRLSSTRISLIKFQVKQTLCHPKEKAGQQNS